jgi:hypothetical protein
MKNDELVKLKKFYITKEKYSKKPKINSSQKKILFLISSFIICFFMYKIFYFIYSIISKKPIIKIGQNNPTYNINNEVPINEEDSNKKVYLSNLTTPISHSEHLEDIILNVFFYDIHYGFYIDIGDSTQSGEYSVTKHFYLRGWRGINIRPIKEEYEQLVKERYRDINLNFYIGGTVDMNYIQQNNSVNISTIIQKYIPNSQEIHFCRIHTFRDEKKVLLGYDFINYRPKIFCVESEELRPNYQNFEYILINNGYSFGYQYKNVRYYIDNNDKKINLKERMNFINDVIQEYQKKKM